MILNILKATNPNDIGILRATSQDVVTFDQELRDLAENMLDTMIAANGAGLAAPQIGINLNLFVMRTERGIEDNTRESIVMANPAIIESSEKYLDFEGCLSIPDMFGKVWREKHLKATYFDVDGSQREFVGNGFSARVLQHELDHLFGVLYPDKAVAMFSSMKKG